MATFTNPDTVYRMTTGTTIPAAWGDTVNDDINALYGDSGWTTPASFTNSWTNSANVAYMLIGRVVYLRGTLGAGTAGDSAFTLPAGYRPSVSLVFATQGNATGTVNSITIATSGTVTPGSSIATHLENVAFPVV